MKLILQNRERLLSLGQFLVDEFDNIITRIRAAWNVEHMPDGEHGNVHAQTVTTGRVTYSDIVSAQIEVDQVDNYDPGLDTAAILRLNSTQDEITVTGLKVPQDANGVVLDGRMLILENVSISGTIFILKDDGQESFPRNRFHIPRGPAPGGANATNVFYLHPSQLLVLIYNAARARWFIQSHSNDNTIGFTEFGSSQNNLQVTGSYRTLRTWRLSATAAGLSVTGFLATLIPSTERKTVVNDGLYTIAISHANTSSSAANRVYCPGGVRYLLHPRESIDLQRIASGGWRIIEKADQWVDVDYDADNFVPTGGVTPTWTVDEADQTTYCYQIDGNMMTVAFQFSSTSVSGSPTALTIPIPAGRVSARDIRNALATVSEAGTGMPGAYCRVVSGGTTILLVKDTASTAWANATNTTNIGGQITFMVRDDCASISENHTDVAHGDTSHADADHSDTAHSDVAHGDSHGDSAHSDTAHADVAHVDTHSDTAHSDTAHSDSHSDSHGDTSHTDTHSDVAHADVAHSDEHTDTHFDNEGPFNHHDSHFDSHGDIAHSDTTHSDSHGDTSHTDTHSDVAHSDVAHADVSHVDTHSDTAHSDSAHVDTGHSDTHSDTVPHSDVAHSDVAHGDTSHADSVHQDVGYHCDTAHSDI